MMEKIKAAIIDDGVSSSPRNVVGFWQINEDLTVSEASFSNEVNPNHATTCLKIIQKYDKSENVIWHSIKTINHKTLRGNLNCFLKALEFCADLDVKIIHLSIGSGYHQDFPEIERRIRQLAENGAIIIAANNNRNTVTYPANLPYVIGVECDAALRDDQYTFSQNFINTIDFHASSTHVLRQNANVYITPFSNSYAAPLITSKVLSFLKSNVNASFDEVYQFLQCNAINYSENSKGNYTNCLFPDNSQTAIFHFAENMNEYNNIMLSDKPDPIAYSQLFLTSKNYKKELKKFDPTNFNQIIVNFSFDITEKNDILSYIHKQYKQKLIVYHNDLTFYYPFRPEENNEIYSFKSHSESKTKDKIINTDIPVICFCGFSVQSTMKLIKCVASYFEKMNYYCISSMDFSITELFGFHVIPPNIDIGSYIDYMWDYFRCDIMILGITRPYIPENRKNISIWVLNSDFNSAEQVHVSEEQAKILLSDGSETELIKKLHSILL